MAIDNTENMSPKVIERVNQLATAVVERKNDTLLNLGNVDFETKMIKLDLDEECMKDLNTDNGYIVGRPKGGIKKNIRDPDGVFSPRFGQTLDDMNPFENRYKCACRSDEGGLSGRVYHGIVCKKCGTEVRFIDDKFDYFAWIRLGEDYRIIHPNLFKAIEFLIGSKRLNNIINLQDNKSINGHSLDDEAKTKDEPFYGIGMMAFRERIEEVLAFYIKKFPNKREHYNEIMRNKKKIFTRSIPVFTTHLRPYKVEGDNFSFGTTNEQYIMMTNLVDRINRIDLKIHRKAKPKDSLLYDLQMKLMELSGEIEKILSGKKGSVRLLFGGRYNFTSRNVIIPEPSLGVDEVTLAYTALVELLQQRIINILQKSYHMSYDEAYKLWSKASIRKDNRIWQIIENIIEHGEEVPDGNGNMVRRRGIPVLINRNPTISYGGIMQMFCVAVTDTYTMGVPLQILSTLAADFDGDVLNIMYIINKAFFYECFRIYNPRNAMFISRNDGMFNSAFNHARDTIVNLNSFVFMCRKNYTQEQLMAIRQLQQR